MTSDSRDRAQTALGYLERAWSFEQSCEEETDSQLADMAKEGRSLIYNIGGGLEILSMMGSCFWGCNGEDHTVVYLCARAASNGHAAVRLLRMGYYDESLLLSRSIGETANLLALFCKDSKALAEYRQSQESWESAWQKFSPANVRKRLGDPPIDTHRYGSLSARSAHPRPDLNPQSFNLLKLPSTGMMFQQIGLLVSLNELVRPLAYACLSAVSLLDISDKVRQKILAEANDLLNRVGRLDLHGLEDMYKLIKIVNTDP